MSHEIFIYSKSPGLSSFMKIDKGLIKNASKLALESFSQNSETTIILCNNNFIQKYNKQYRGLDKATNVLSFPAENFIHEDTDNNIKYLGDVIVSIEKIFQEATEQSKLPEHHLLHMVIHGMLHLIGYDHIDPKDQEIMENLEISLLSRINISNPYL